MCAQRPTQCARGYVAVQCKVVHDDVYERGKSARKLEPVSNRFSCAGAQFPQKFQVQITLTNPRRDCEPRGRPFCNALAANPGMKSERARVPNFYILYLPATWAAISSRVLLVLHLHTRAATWKRHVV